VDQKRIAVRFFHAGVMVSGKSVSVAFSFGVSAQKSGSIGLPQGLSNESRSVVRIYHSHP
jgi:hypothetical protein